MTDFPLRHIAIIMDGNGRWATEQGLPRIKGHEKGIESVEITIEACMQEGIKYLSLFAFSVENWSRPKIEVDALMRFLGIYLDKKLSTFHEKKIRFCAVGRIEMLPEIIQKKIAKVSNDTKDYDALILTLALSYSGKAEIVDTAKKIAEKTVKNEICVDDINEELFSKNLYAPGIPDVDLMIRTSGELRLSNFFLWQAAYAEFIFLNKYWPEFNESDIVEAKKEYIARQRRFGSI